MLVIREWINLLWSKNATHLTYRDGFQLWEAWKLVTTCSLRPLLVLVDRIQDVHRFRDQIWQKSV